MKIYLLAILCCVMLISEIAKADELPVITAIVKVTKYKVEIRGKKTEGFGFVIIHPEKNKDTKIIGHTSPARSMPLPAVFMQEGLKLEIKYTAPAWEMLHFWADQVVIIKEMKLAQEEK